MGVCAAEMQGNLTASTLSAAVENGERERAASPDEVPIGEWEVQRVHQPCGVTSAPTEITSAPSPSDGPQVILDGYCCF